jgi:hypothetical protein
VGVQKVPTELWTSSFSRDAGAFNIADPLARFRDVNKSVRHAGVLDLHFQTAQTVAAVLDSVLPSAAYYERMQDGSGGWVWVVTGTGRHTTQRLHKLVDVVQHYLDTCGYTYKLGKDGEGQVGAFYVKLKQ